MLKISITKLHLNKKINTNLLKQVVKETLKHEGVLDAEVSVVLGDDELLKKLNKQYRGVDKATDVLAFGYSGDINVTQKTIIGEIIISIDAVRRQAKEYHHSFEKELTILLIHGGLHILGYDHTSEYSPKEPMAIRAEEILRGLKK